MKKRVKITKAPGGKPSVGDQMGYGLYRGQGVRDFEQFNPSDPSANLRSVYPETSRENANIEVEKGEKIIAKNGMNIYDVNGKKHSQGGTPVNAEPGSYVVSDYIKAPKIMQSLMGFDVKSDKKKDNTWSKVLDSKVKSSDYNRLSNILQMAKNGMQVDPLELKTAQIKFPMYQDYVSKAALGNELTKALDGKEYSIPELAMPALQKLTGDVENMVPSQPEMMHGGYVLPKALTGLYFDDEDEDNGPGKKYKVKNKEVEAKAVKTAPTGYTQYDPVNYPELYYKAGVPGSSTPGYSTNGYTVSGGGRGRVTVEDILNNPKKYKTFHKMMEGAPDDVKAQAAYDLWKTGKMPGKYVPAIDIAEIPDDFVYIEQPEITTTDNGGGETTTTTTDDTPKDKDTPKTTTTTTFKATPPINTNIGLYPQDVLNTANAILNQYAYPTIGPFEGRYNPIYMDPASISTEAADRLIQSQGRTAMEDASLYGTSPQTQNAKLAQINASVLPAMIQNRMQTNAQNVQSDMAVRQFNAQVANQAALQDAARSTSLYDKTAKLAMNEAEQKVRGRTNVVNPINKAITNWGMTKVVNSLFPQYAFNPANFETFFKGGKGFWNDASSSGAGDMSKYGELYKQASEIAKQTGLSDPNKIHELAIKIMTPYIKSASDGDATSKAEFLKQITQGSKEGGSFIPVYQLGGW